MLSSNLLPIEKEEKRIPSSQLVEYKEKITQSKNALENSLIKAGFNSKFVSIVVLEIEKIQFIENYQKLYKSIIKFYHPATTNFSSLWLELPALSGEIKAIEHLISRTYDLHGSPPFWASLLKSATKSGSAKALQCVAQHAVNSGIKIDYYIDKYEERINILHSAAKSGSVEAIKFVIQLEFIHIDSFDNDFRDILHHAAWGGSVKALEFVIGLGFNVKREDHSSHDILHYATQSGSVKTVKFVRLLNYILGLNLSGQKDPDSMLNTALIKKALETPIEKLMLDEIQKTEKMGNFLENRLFRCIKKISEQNKIDVLRQGALIGSIPIMEFALKIGHDPTRYDEHGKRNLLCGAALSRSVEAVKFVLLLNQNYQLNIPSSSINIIELCQDQPQKKQIKKTKKIALPSRTENKEEIEQKNEKSVDTILLWKDILIQAGCDSSFIHMMASSNSLKKKTYTGLDSFKLDTLPTDWLEEIVKYCDEESRNALSLTSKQNNKKITQSINILKNTLIKAGFQHDIIDAKQITFIKNYQKLYKSIIKFYPPDNRYLSVANLSALSGEVEAIKHTMSERAGRHTYDFFWQELLENAVKSGSANAIKYIILYIFNSTGKIDKKITTSYSGNNILHHAAWSGSVEAIECVIGLGEVIGIYDRDDNFNNLLSYAVQSGSVKTLKFVKLLNYILGLNLPEVQNVPPLSNAILIKKVLETSNEKLMADEVQQEEKKNNSFENSLFVCVKKISEQKKADALLRGALIGSIQVMQYALKIGYNPKNYEKIDRELILSCAIGSRSIEAIKFVLLLNHDDQFNIDPSTIELNQSLNQIESIKSLLKTPVNELVLERSLKQKNVDPMLIDNFFTEINQHRKKYGQDTPYIKQTVALIEQATTNPSQVGEEDFLRATNSLVASRSKQALGITLMLIGISLGIISILSFGITLGIISLSLFISIKFAIAGTITAGPLIYGGYSLFQAGLAKDPLLSAKPVARALGIMPQPI